MRPNRRLLLSALSAAPLVGAGAVQAQINGGAAQTDFTVTPEQFDPAAGTGSTTVDTTATAAAARAIEARGYGRLLLSRPYQLGAPLALACDHAVIEWATPHALLVLHHTGDGLVLGRQKSTGGARANDIHLIRPNIVQDAQGTKGIAIVAYQITGLRLHEPTIHGVLHGVALGEDHPLADNDVCEVYMTAPSISPGGGTGVMFRCGSIADVYGGKLNGQGATDTAAVLFGGERRNWDGVSWTQGTWEQWAVHLRLAGQGGGNAIFEGLQLDRATERGFDLTPAPGGEARHICISNPNLSDREDAPSPNASVGIYASNERGGLVDDIRIRGGRIEGFGRQGVYCKGAQRVSLVGADIHGCGGQTKNTWASAHFANCGIVSAHGNQLSSPSHRSGLKFEGKAQRNDDDDLGRSNTIVGALTQPVES